MSERSERPVVPLRLVLEFGETVELDGSTLYDPVAEAGGGVADAAASGGVFWSGAVGLHEGVSACRCGAGCVGAGGAWALGRVASAAGHVEPVAVEQRRVTSARRMSAAAVLRSAEDFDDVTMIAVVDAAARWLDEPEGDEYAYALLGAVTDGPTQLRAYGELLGTGGVR